MITKGMKIEYLAKFGIIVLYHVKMLRDGHERLYIDQIKNQNFTTRTLDQTLASQILDRLYWGYKLQEEQE